MAGGLRFRSEATLISSFSAPFTVAASPIILVPTSQMVGIQRVGVYRMIMVAEAQTNFQFQDTAGNPISARYNLSAAGSTVTLDTPINGDPWWQTTVAGRGLQLVLTGTGPVDADIWVAWGA